MTKPNAAVQQLQAEARADYKKHNSPATAAAVRLQQGQTQTNGNAAAGAARGHR